VSGPVARWTFEAIVETQTATHLGGGDGGAADLTIGRDALSGRPLLPGTTLAGLLRNYLVACDTGYYSPEGRGGPAERLFGASRGNDYGTQSAAITFDAIAEPDAKPVEIRDGVAIDGSTGTAADHAKYDFEVLAPGTRFPIRVDLVVRSAVGSEGEDDLVSWAARALLGLQHGAIHLGAKASRGLGRIAVHSWQVERFPLTSEADCARWLASDHARPGQKMSPQEDVLEAMSTVRGTRVEPAGNGPRPALSFEVPVRFEEPLLIGAPGADAAAPDDVHLTAGGRPILSGTSAAGVLRHRAWAITELVHDENPANELINFLFGPKLPERETSRAKRPAVQQSRIWFDEDVIDRATDSTNKTVGREERRTRVALDRFTGGVLSGRLFEQQPYVGGQVRLKAEVKSVAGGVSSSVAAGLLVLMYRDVLDGLVTFGGQEATGFGLVAAHGEATVTMGDGRSGSLHSPLAEELVSAFCSWDGKTNIDSSALGAPT